MANKRFIYDEYGIVSADFVNIDLANDNRKFLNPYNIGLLTHPVAIKATEVAVHFFEQVRQELLRGCVTRAEYLFCNRLTEPKELCFGYAEKGIVGKGIHELAQYVINQIYYINNHLIHEIKRIEDIKLFIDNIGDDTIENIVKKYVEMNVAHPFMEGNGRSTRIWLDLILKKNLRKCVDWSKIDKRAYLTAMQKSPVDYTDILALISNALTDEIDNREMFMKGIDYSYYYETED